MSDHVPPHSRPGRLKKMAVVATAMTTSMLSVGFAEPSAAADTSACGSVPEGYNLIDDDKRILYGTEGNDFICGNERNNVIVGGGGDDIMIGLGGDDRFNGGDGNDVIKGGPGQDRIRGGDGDDVIFGDDGNDKLKGQAGNDILDGGAGDDSVFAGRGDDIAKGGSGNDLVSGNAGKDTVEGGEGNDTVRGKGGVDFIDGGPGNDLANGGAGQDACVAEELRLCENGTTTPVEPDPEPEPEPEPATPVEELTATIENSVLAKHNATSPWIGEAWAYIQANGTVQVSDLAGGTAGTVSSNCSFTSAALPACEADTFTMDPAFLTSESVIIHELAHVFEGTDGLPIGAGPFGKAQLYFEKTYGDVCNYAELMADAMLHSVDPDAFLYYWEVACAGDVPEKPTAADMAILNAALDGIDTGWFASNYTNGAQGWAAITNADPEGLLSYRLVTSQKDEFGGYCSVSHTMAVIFQATTDDNPFADGGC